MLNRTDIDRPKLLRSQVLDCITIGVLQVDDHGVVYSANSKALEILGLSVNEIEGASYFDWKHVNNEGEVIGTDLLPISQSIKLGHEVKDFIHGWVISKNSIRWVSETSVPVYKGESLIGCVCSFNELTDHGDKPGFSSEVDVDILSLIDKFSDDLVIIHRDDFTYELITRGIRNFLGYSEQEMIELKTEELFHFNDLARLKKVFNKLINNGLNESKVRYRLKNKDGSFRLFEGVLTPLNVSSETLYIKNKIREVSEQEIAQELLIKSEERYHSLIAEAPFSISIYNSDGVLIDANPTYSEIWETDLNDLLIEKNIFDEENFQNEEIQGVLQHAFSGKRGDLTLEITTKSKRVKKLLIKYFPLIDHSGNFYNTVFMCEDITARVDYEKKIKAGERMKQEILNSLEDAILVIGKNGQVININKRLQNYLISSPYRSLKVGEDVFTFIDLFEEKEIIKTGLESVLARATSFFDYEIKLADGKWYNMKVTQLKYLEGAVISWQNINTRKEIEIALEKSLIKYRNIYNRAPVMMHSINSNAEIMSVSDFWLEKMGYDRKEVIGRKVTDFMTKNQRKSFLSDLDEFFEKGYIRNIPCEFLTKKGAVLDVLLSATSEYDENGKFERSLSGMADVTELRRTERELKRSRQDLLEAQRISRIGNYEINLKEHTFLLSHEVLAMMGLPSNKGSLKLIENIIHEDDQEEFFDKLEYSAKTGEDFFYVFRIYHYMTKKVKWISCRGKTLDSNSRGVDVMIGTVQDISEQKVAEEKIRRLSDRLLLATELAEIAVWEFSLDDNEVFWDKQMYEIFENVVVPFQSFKDLSKYIHEEDLNQLHEIFRKVKAGERFIEADLKIKVKSGFKYLRTYTRIIKNENHRVLRALGVLYDNTADKTLQLKLESSLEDKNILLKEVNHRVKNNMQLISSILALKSYDLKDEDSKTVFEEINERIKSMAVIHDQLYKFYNVSEINIAEYLEHISRELSILYGSENKQIIVEADYKLFDVDKVLLFGLIVSELVSNAFKHGLGGLENGKVKVIFKVQPNNANYLVVFSDGRTIPANILEMQTKGLGISLIKTFTRQLNGELSLHEENGIAITF